MSSSVLRPDSYEINDAADSTETNERDANAVPRFVPREGVRGDDTADVSEPNLPRRADGATVMAAKVQVKPADDDWHGAVSAHGDQEQGRVLYVPMRVHGQKDGKTADGDKDWDQSESEAVLDSIREVGDYHGENECARPWWHTVELRADLRVIVGSDDGWSEEGISGRSHTRISPLSCAHDFPTHP